MFYAYNEKIKATEGIELPDQEKIRTLGEKEIHKYLGVLEVDAIKQAGKKQKKYTSRERENYSEPNYIAEISSKV